MAFHARPALAIASTALFLFSSAPPAHAELSTRRCPKLQGTAAELFDQQKVCKTVATELLKGSKGNLGNALLNSMKGAPATIKKAVPKKKHPRVHTSSPRLAAPKVQRPKQVRRVTSLTDHAAPRRIPVEPPAAPAEKRTEAAPKSTPRHRASTPTAIRPMPIRPTPTVQSSSEPLNSPAVVADREQADSGTNPRPVALAAVLLLLLFVGFRMIHRKPATAGSTRFIGHPTKAESRRDNPTQTTVEPLALEACLANPTGIGIVGSGAEGFLRAALVEILTKTDAHVIVTSDDLAQLLPSTEARALVTAHPRVKIWHSLEEAAAGYLTVSVASPDSADHTYWFAHLDEPDWPSANTDVLAPLLNSSLTALILGAWPEGPTCVIGGDGSINVLDSDLTPGAARLLTEREAVRQLYSAPH